MHSAQLLIVLAVATVTLGAVTVLRRAGIPAPVTLVVAGLVIGFLPFVPDVSLNPQLVLLGLLPLLVFDAAVTSSPTAFSRDAPMIGVLAVLLVIITAVSVAAVAHWLGHLPWAIAFVLGTAVGPTDAAAATSIARRLGLPRRLVTILEGEALFNDGTALVLYAAAVTAAVSGRFSPAGTAGSILYSAVAGAAIGLVVGLIGRRLRDRVDDPPLEIAGSILLAYVAYIPAEAVHASGVLAAVTCGLYLGWHSSGDAFSARSRLQSGAFWQTLVFLVEAFLFVLTGLSFHTFTREASGPVGRLVLTGTVVVLTVTGVRLFWMWAFGRLIRARRRYRTLAGSLGWRERTLLGWAGMRGAITLAALLAVPEVSRTGQPLAGRDEEVYLGFAVIAGTLVVQGLTLPFLVRRLRLREHPSVADAEIQARLEITQAVLDYLGEVCADRDLPAELTDGLRARYLSRLRRLETMVDGDPEEEATATAAADFELRQDLIDMQRRKLAELRDGGRVGATTVRVIEHDLDLEEARLTGPAR
jgi:CPA1 family monovalent cation:H+ antiporter